MASHNSSWMLKKRKLGRRSLKTIGSLMRFKRKKSSSKRSRRRWTRRLLSQKRWMMHLTKYQDILWVKLKTTKDIVKGMALEGKAGLLDLHIFPRIPLHPTESLVQGQSANHFPIPGVIQGTSQEAYQGLLSHEGGPFHRIDSTFRQENAHCLLITNIHHEDLGHP